MRHGSHIDPPNRFESTHREPDWEHWDGDAESLPADDSHPIVYLDDDSQSIISENDSPDIPFQYSLNPYRGCAHGCAYCYARNTHEYLGFNAGLDFETKIMVKHRAAQLFRQFLAKRTEAASPIAFSGVTDCYQPIERKLRLTRSCLEVALDFRQPVGIVTKNAAIVRDLDLLRELSARRLVHVYISITTLDPELARDLEPRTSIPAARLRAIRELARVGVPVGVMCAPIIPGVNSSEVPTILAAAAEHGAQTAGKILLRLPQTVLPVFQEWLQRVMPSRAASILQLIRQTRGGRLNDPQFGKRMRGAGPIADQISELFHIFSRKHGLDQPLPPQDGSHFSVPHSGLRQGRLF
ncbi:MAG TPA: PA0069 family radical SAM protein [Pirellulaceae bacterium]|nr:PA0069 family radical SAM protein [Pirellulaceae bacterium]